MATSNKNSQVPTQDGMPDLRRSIPTPARESHDYSQESYSEPNVIRNTMPPPPNPNNTGGGKDNQK